MTADLRQLLEQLFSESVVLLRLHAGPQKNDATSCWATGFVLSRDGLIGSTHHGLFPLHPGLVEVIWRGKPYAATYEADWSDHRSDFAVFRVAPNDLGLTEMRPMPILGTPLEAHEVVGDIAAIGYTPSDSYAPQRLRILDGAALALEQYDVPTPAHSRATIETLDVIGGGGSSGSPIFHLQQFRVIGFVQGHLLGTTQRLGRSRPLAELFDKLPLHALQPDWDAACQRADQAKRAFFRRPGKALPQYFATAADLAALASEHNQRLIAALQQAGIYSDELFLRRQVATRLQHCIASPEAPVAILTGESGTGKTNLLVDLSLHCPADVITLLITGASLDGSDTIAALPARIGFDGSLADLACCLRRANYRLLLILDGYNEWSLASRRHLADIVIHVGKLAHDRKLAVQAIISIKLEFLREHVHELTVTGEQDAGFPRQLLHHERSPLRSPRTTTRAPSDAKKITRPYIQVPFLSDAFPATATSEQEAMYELFRERGTMSDASGHKVGIRPLASYDQLSDSIRAFLDRPLLLRQFMMRYHQQPIPEGVVRAALYREVLTPHISSAVPQWLTREAVEVLLGNLAQHLCRAGVTALPYRLLSREPWFDRGIVELLLAHTFFLSRTPCDRSMIGATTLGFSSEWLLQYYLAIDLWEEIALEAGDGTAYLNAGLAACVDGRLDQFIGALCHIAEWALTQDHRTLRSLLQVAAGEEHDPRRFMFVASVLEFVRTHYSLTQPLPADVLDPPASFAEVLASCRDVLDDHALQRVLRYVERLGDDALRDSIALLESHSELWEQLGSTWREEIGPVRALKLFRLDTRTDVTRARDILEGLDEAAVPAGRRSLVHFVEGRCHQYFQDYDRALESYQRGACHDDGYAHQCRYQTAFVLFFARSDYAGAIRRLDAVTEGDGESADSLRSRCLTELAQFDQARTLLEKMLTRTRRRLPRARVQRDLARVLALAFEDDAVECATQACKLSEPATNRLVFLQCREVLAFVLACHHGDLSQALDLVTASLAELEQIQHGPTQSWLLQSAAMIHALGGQAEPMAAALGHVARLEPSPNQRRLSRFIELLEQHLTAGAQATTQLTGELDVLYAQYCEAGQMWYAALLQQMRAARTREAKLTRPALQLPGINWENFLASPLVGAIRAARPISQALIAQPAAISPPEPGTEADGQVFIAADVHPLLLAGPSRALPRNSRGPGPDRTA